MKPVRCGPVCRGRRRSGRPRRVHARCGIPMLRRQRDRACSSAGAAGRMVRRAFRARRRVRLRRFLAGGAWSGRDGSGWWRRCRGGGAGLRCAGAGCSGGVASGGCGIHALWRVSTVRHELMPGSLARLESGHGSGSVLCELRNRLAVGGCAGVRRIAQTVVLRMIWPVRCQFCCESRGARDRGVRHQACGRSAQDRGGYDSPDGLSTARQARGRGGVAQVGDLLRDRLRRVQARYPEHRGKQRGDDGFMTLGLACKPADEKPDYENAENRE